MENLRNTKKTMPKKLKIKALIQARMGSKRLPKKVMLKIGGKTIIQIIFERLKHSKEIDGIILSTSSSKENDVLAKHANKIRLKYHRGSENDLISRHLGALRKANADTFVRITADCPLVEPRIINDMIKIYRRQYNKIDFMTNCLPPTYPDGLDIDIISKSVLEKLDKEITNPLHREYYAVYIMENPDKFKIYNFSNNKNISYLRWTLDYPEDLKFIKKIFYNFRNQKIFFTQDILQFINKNPEILKINKKRVDKTIINNIRSKVYHHGKNLFSQKRKYNSKTH